MKKKKFLLTLILLVFIIPNTVSANTLGDLNYWYSDGNSIGRWHDSRYIYSTTLDDSFDTNQVIDLVGHAQTQWSNAGISSSRTPVKSGANIKVYAGRLENIQKLYPNFKSTDAGLAHYKNTVTEGS